MKRAYLVITMAILFVSCVARHHNIEKYAGTYDFYKYEIQYYNGDNTADSSITVNDIGEMGLYNNGSDDFNYFVYTASAAPRSWFDYGCPNPVCWFPDEGNGSSITVATADYTEFVIYTVEKDGKKKYKWTLVKILSSGALDYIETLYLEKTK